MDQITTLTFFKFNNNKFWALKQMGFAQKKLKGVKDLEFYKFLGTGGGRGFSLWPDFSMYAFLGVWKNRDAYKKCFDSFNIFLEYKERADFQRNLELISIKSHGFWNGKNPFKSQNLRLEMLKKKLLY